MTSFLFQGPTYTSRLDQYMHKYPYGFDPMLSPSRPVSFFFLFLGLFSLVCHSVHSWMVDLLERKKD